MMRMKGLKYVPGALVLVTATAIGIPGCSAAADAAKGCDGLDVTVGAQAAVKAFSQAAVNLELRAKDVEARFLAVCNKMNADLGLDTTKTTASEACSVLKARVDSAVAAGVTVSAQIVFNCTADVKVQADCEAQCNASLKCDVKAQCEPGKLVVACRGTCDASCEVQKPDFMCNGSCSGTCTATAAVQCLGTCEGSCTAPMWTGSCDVGCSANFSGTCGGMCNGMCDGMNSTGTCNGKCVGTCSANATGSCSAQCMGKFKGGTCSGMCTGSCTGSASAMCNGTCNGTCTFTQPTATCEGECHGSCSAEASPPRCTGTLSCMGAAECQGSCSADASAKVDCSKPQATVVVQGDLKLQQALEAHINEWAVAFNMLTALKDPVAELASKGAATFSALGEVGVSGATCVASGVSAAASASASVSVSVSASASFNASSM